MVGKDWIAGTKDLTWLDFAFWENLEMLDLLAGGKFDEYYPAFAAYRKRFVTNPTFAKIWADDSKSMKYPFNNDSAWFGSRNEGKA